ncbi:hypothetical protein RI543_002830 [Arxiozyma heterogenica]|uniref:Uncharacterized protein n=1 Tax=Arxiozyma heterogenica TaxID=278026 RepID=A0AAN7WLK4_9SACH|nr:hypothetical protein RI543_002830 [Kazachstania heterogenica]
MYDEILGFIYANIKPFSSTNSKIFNKQTQQLLVTSQQLLLNNLLFILVNSSNKKTQENLPRILLPWCQK